MKRLITAKSINEQIEYLVKKYNQTPIVDKYFPPVYTLDEIKNEFLQLGIKIESTENSTETETIKTPCGWLTVDIHQKDNSTWLFLGSYDEDELSEEE